MTGVRKIIEHSGLTFFPLEVTLFLGKNFSVMLGRF